MRACAVAFALGCLSIGCGDNTKLCDRAVVGNICTIAGTGESGYSGEEGPATEARLSLPIDTLAAPDGSVYVVDWNNHRVRKITTDGMIHFVAGNGELGGGIDDPASGNFNHPTQIIFDPTGASLYIAAWHNSSVLEIDLATGAIVNSCGDGRRAYFGDEGPALTASLNLPSSIAWDPQSDLVIMDQANQVIRAIDRGGIIHRVAGNCVVDAPAPNGPGACAAAPPAACPAPSGVTTCGDPMMWCSKPCTPGYTGDDLPAIDLRMAQQFGQATDPGGKIVFDHAGNLYFADVANDLIRMIDTQGIVHRVAGSPPQNGIAQPGYAGDGGPARDAKINHPIDLALGGDGTIYFSDVYNHCVRAIAPDHTIRTVAGVCGTKGNAGEDGPATSALFNRPYGVEWAAPNTLYIADTGNSVIRAVHLP